MRISLVLSEVPETGEIRDHPFGRSALLSIAAIFYFELFDCLLEILDTGRADSRLR